MSDMNSFPCDLRGELRSDGPLPPGYVVELRGNQGPIMGGEVDVDPTGSFQFANINPGSYILVVKTHSGAVVHQEFVDVNGSAGSLWIQLPKLKKPARPVSGTVSVARLSHKVPPKARKEFEKASKAESKGKTKDVIKHLEKALAIDPDYMEAHNNLGTQYLRAEEYAKAELHFRKACELDPGASVPSPTWLLFCWSQSIVPMPRPRPDARSVWTRAVLEPGILWHLLCWTRARAPRKRWSSCSARPLTFPVHI